MEFPLYINTVGTIHRSDTVPTAVFVFQPGGTPIDNVYDDWATLMAQCDTVEGLRTILFDDRFVSPCVIPAGTWDMEDVTWSGRLFTNNFVEVSEGAIFAKLRSFEDGVIVDFVGTTPPVADFGPRESVLLQRGAEISCSGAGPFFFVDQAVGNASFILNLAGRFNSGTNAVVDVTAGTTVVIGVLSISEVNAGTISGAVGSVVILAVIASAAVITETQPAFLGTLVNFNFTKARVDPTDTKTADYTAVANELVRCDPPLLGMTITLPSAFDHRGMSVIVKNITTSANVITIVPSGGDTIDGGASTTIASILGASTFVSDGVSDWMVI